MRSIQTALCQQPNLVVLTYDPHMAQLLHWAQGHGRQRPGEWGPPALAKLSTLSFLNKVLHAKPISHAELSNHLLHNRLSHSHADSVQQTNFDEGGRQHTT